MSEVTIGLYGDIRVGAKVFLYSQDGQTFKHKFKSEHTITRVLKSRIYVSDIKLWFSSRGTIPCYTYYTAFNFLSFDKPK